MIIYFLTSYGYWQSAESLHYDGWYRVFYNDERTCRKYERQFNRNINRYDVRGVCKSVLGEGKRSASENL